MGQTDARYGWETGPFGIAGATALRKTVSPLGFQDRSYLTFLMAMMKKQPMMARAMATGKVKL